MSNSFVPPAVCEDVAAARNYRRIESGRQLAAYDHQFTERQQQIPGLLFPAYQLGKDDPYTYVLRPDKPRMGYDGKMVKYEWPERVPLCLDVLPRYRDALADATIPIWFTEGAKKADALASAFGASIVPINLNGVWGWRRRGKDGASHPIEDLDTIAWDGRLVVLAFDNDVTRKAEVQQALKALARHLKDRGATVRILVLPHDGEKVGVDDALASGMTPEVLRAYVRNVDDLPPPASASESTARRYRTEDEIEQLRPPTWLIKGVIPAGEVTMASGPGDTGKTFILVDMAKRVAQHYPVMYIAAEDAGGIRIRKRAWETHHNLPKNGNFLMWDNALQLFDAGDVASFIDEVRPLGLRLIVIDTLSQSIAGADENSNGDMRIVLGHCQRIAHETGAAVVFIHHTTKNGDTFRGASALKNDSYGHLEVSRDDDLIRFECGRIKNTKAFAPRFFKLVDVATDIADEDGNPITSCIIAPADRVPSGDTLTRNQIKMLESLLLMTDAQGGAATTELEKATGLVGNSFYSALKRLRNLGLVDKGEKRTDPLTITAAGRARLSVESTNPEHQSSVTTIDASPPFEVNAHLGELLPFLPGSNDGSNEGGSNPELLPKDPGSNDGSNTPQNGHANGASYHAATNGIGDSDAVATTATKLLPNTNGSNHKLTTTSLSPLGEGVGSNGSRNGERNESQIDHDLRRGAEITKALATGNVKAARKAANEIRGRKAQKAADLKIEEYEAAHKAGEVTA